MKRCRMQMKNSFLAMLLVTVLLSLTVIMAAGLIGPTYADQTITATCYNPVKSSLPMGRVEVFDVAQAAQVCNSLYYDCRGKCIACYQDSDYFDNVCMDIYGNTFLK